MTKEQAINLFMEKFHVDGYEFRDSKEYSIEDFFNVIFDEFENMLNDAYKNGRIAEYY